MRTSLAAFAGLLLLARLLAVGPPPAPLPSEIDRLIEQLGDDNFRTRRAAAARLRAAGEAAEAALEKAARSKDAEVSSTAATILEEFRWGLYPGTPPRVAELVKSYRDGANPGAMTRRDVLKQLFLLGPAGARAAWKFTRAEKGAFRTLLFADISATITHGMPFLVEDNRLDLALKVLEPGAREGHRPCAAHYAAVLKMTGGLADRVTAAEAELKKSPGDKNLATLLIFLLRMNGQPGRAAKLAADASLTDLEEAMLYEAGDWKALHARPERVNAGLHTRQKGYHAAYARLAGEGKAADKVLDDLLDVFTDRLDPLPYAKVMFINGRPAKGVELLTRNKLHRKIAFEIYAAQGHWSKALDLAEEVLPGNDNDAGVLEVLRARELYALGERDKAADVLKGYADQLDRGRVGPWAEELVQSEVQNGRRAEALVAAARILTHGNDATWPGRLFDKLFANRVEEAHALWSALRLVEPKDTPERGMARLDAFLEGKASEKELDAFLAAGRVRARTLPDADRLRWGLAEAAAGCKQVAQAEALLRGSKLPYALVRWGDLAAGEKNWAEAARRYWAAFQRAARVTPPPARVGEDAKDFVCALALYLHGHALIQAGQRGDGQRRVEQAHGLLLADGPQNWALAKALTGREHKEAAIRQYTQMSRLCEPVLHDRGSFHTGEGFRGLALAATAKKDFLLAADAWERCFLRLMAPTTNFTRGLFYVTAQGFIHQTRARGLAIAGKFDEARAEAALALAYLPLNTELGVLVVPELTKRGRKKDADELYQGLQRKLEEALKTYPAAAGLLNRSAWLAACCRRDLEMAEKRARQAVKLAPEMAAHHGTLAEVLFQQGDNEGAAAAIEKARQLAPKTALYQRQLKRIKAGDPKAAVPLDD